MRFVIDQDLTSILRIDWPLTGKYRRPAQDRAGVRGPSTAGESFSPAQANHRILILRRSGVTLALYCFAGAHDPLFSRGWA